MLYLRASSRDMRMVVDSKKLINTGKTGRCRRLCGGAVSVYAIKTT